MCIRDSSALWSKVAKASNSHSPALRSLAAKRSFLERRTPKQQSVQNSRLETGPQCSGLQLQPIRYNEVG
eukprot:998243-Alexandrium_andersonii.AAC.1